MLDSVVAAAIVAGIVSFAGLWMQSHKERKWRREDAEREMKRTAYVEFLTALEEYQETSQPEAPASSLQEARHLEALTNMNRSLAVIDLVAPEIVMHGATRAADVAGLPRGEERDTVLDELLNQMRSDLGTLPGVRSLRRGEDGTLY